MQQSSCLFQPRVHQGTLGLLEHIFASSFGSLRHLCPLHTRRANTAASLNTSALGSNSLDRSLTSACVCGPSFLRPLTPLTRQRWKNPAWRTEELACGERQLASPAKQEGRKVLKKMARQQCSKTSAHVEKPTTMRRKTLKGICLSHTHLRSLEDQSSSSSVG